VDTKTIAPHSTAWQTRVMEPAPQAGATTAASDGLLATSMTSKMFSLIGV
jgi:hypothetical protein